MTLTDSDVNGQSSLLCLFYVCGSLGLIHSNLDVADLLTRMASCVTRKGLDKLRDKVPDALKQDDYVRMFAQA